jgi:hypothetical protein
MPPARQSQARRIPPTFGTTDASVAARTAELEVSDMAINHNRVRGSLVVALMATLAVSVAVNVLQANRIYGLLSSPRQSSRVGRPAPILRGVMRGQPTVIDYGSRPTVLYYFRSTCGWCTQNWPSVRALANQAGDRFRLIAVTAEAQAAATLSQLGIDMELLASMDQGSQADWRFKGTPQTVVVSNQGVVTHDWPGPYIGEVQREIEDLLSVRLPSLHPLR